MLGLLAVVTLLLGGRGNSDVKNITSQGYPAEVHTVTTDDGYILLLQRIPYGKNLRQRKGRRKVVFLFHGTLGASNVYTYLGPEYAIGYNLADAGFDVWMGNARGNGYSRRHVTLDPDKDKFQFFDFTYEEIGRFDLPAMIDYVLNITKRDKLFYIGHSQGGTVFYVLNSISAKYQSKFVSAHLLSGVGYNKYYRNKKVKLLSCATDVIDDLSWRSGNVELTSPSNLTTVVFELLVNSTVPPEIMANASVKQSVHFMQNIRDESFRRYDYGATTNMLKYGSYSPPRYDLSNIKVNVTLHYSVGDITQSEIDVQAMVNVMPNAIARKIGRNNFNHMDYLLSKDVKRLVTDYIIEAFKKA